MKSANSAGDLRKITDDRQLEAIVDELFARASAGETCAQHKEIFAECSLVEHQSVGAAFVAR